MHRKLTSIIEPYKPPFFYTSSFSVCPWNQMSFSVSSLHFEVQKALVNFALFCVVFAHLTGQKETGYAASGIIPGKYIISLACLADCLPEQVFFLLSVSVQGYLYTSRMGFAIEISISLLFPSLSGSISNLFEALNTFDFQFSLWLLMVTSSIFIFFTITHFQTFSALLTSTSFRLTLPSCPPKQFSLSLRAEKAEVGDVTTLDTKINTALFFCFFFFQYSESLNVSSLISPKRYVMQDKNYYMQFSNICKQKQKMYILFYSASFVATTGLEKF